MRIKLLIDTDIWLNLAKDYRMAPVLTAIGDLINSEIIELILPEIMLEEFARNRDRVVQDSRRSLSSYFRRVREAVTQFGEDDKKAETLSQLDEIDHKIAMTGEVSKRTLDAIGKIMTTSTPIATSGAAKIKAAERALAKVAPFHLSKNAIADAVLIEIYAEAVAADPGNEHVFITNNTRDFSQHNGDQRLPHADLEPLFQGKSRYATSIVEVIREISGDLLEDYEWEHTYQQPRKLSEILDAEHLLFRQVWYNRHWNLRGGVESGEVKIISDKEFSKLKGYHPEVVVDKIWEGALAAAKRTEEEVGLENLGPWGDFEWGMINGKLSALRWVLGDEWDMLDT
jgi:predicted nucleic acid-binding protein